jgi:hypothetical protein
MSLARSYLAFVQSIHSAAHPQIPTDLLGQLFTAIIESGDWEKKADAADAAIRHIRTHVPLIVPFVTQVGAFCLCFVTLSLSRRDREAAPLLT